MFVIVMIMIQAGSHKVVSNQILYPDMGMCETDHKILVEQLMKTKPSPDAVVYSKCTELSFTEHKAVSKEQI
tara:strand:+ start:625 stop:840 length:216 start_codon:yes stop_codon:yes gene_type:complete